MFIGLGSIEEMIDLAQSAEREGELESALYHYEQAFAHLREDPSRAAPLMRWIGRVHRSRGDLELAEEAYLASEAIAAASNDTGDLASALNCLAIVAQVRARIEEATELYNHARDLASISNDERLAAMIDQNLGTLANTVGDFTAAIDSYRSAYHRFEALGDEIAMVWSLNNLGMVHTDLGEWDTAADCFDKAFVIADRLRDAEQLGTIELNRADLFLKSADLNRARESCDRAFEIFSRIEARGSLGEAYKFYGVLYREMGRPALAVAHFTQAIDAAGETGDRLLEAETLSEWALLDLVSGENRSALQRLNTAHNLFSELHARAELTDLEGRLDRLEENYLRVMRSWAESIEAKDKYTAGHCERVADYACMLAEAVGFKGRDLTWFRMGAFLHDVGKTAVPAEVLNKPGRLTPEEWDTMQQHTTVGDSIVSELHFPWDIRPIVRNHHERWDGAGYPDQLSGEGIPLTARILCVADVYDALTTARSYRAALSVDESLRIMTRDSGKLLDPTLFELFNTLILQRVQETGELSSSDLLQAASSS